MQPSLGLQVTLACQVPIPQAQSSFTVPVKVSVYNSGSTPVTVLKWGTPFDAHAGMLGVFEICDTADGQVLPLDELKISRKLPPSADDLEEIPGGHSLDKVIDITGLCLQEGHDYSIHTKGIWHAVWEGSLVNVTESQLRDCSGAKRGEFQSNFAVVKIQ
ncbi:uncharacterized protein N7482_006381 [Penicillium canariense]|uniref:Uncharacterized protein n=1 Tax=Penicillium canariense TaxID=189055 RepID=A0A9W9LI49_9EURO|nr:uncharacterized protein N7482_006381 [Penicillium canariense]KAJ5159377.1 hypothetical protein N7482_006381 [Penicillium canariense]